jgi:hypothetical protein
MYGGDWAATYYLKNRAPATGLTARVLDPDLVDAV